METMYFKKAIENDDFEIQGAEFLNMTKTKMTIKWFKYGHYFDNDKDSRDIFKITLKKGGRQFTFTFGQSMFKGSEEPSSYDVLSCLTKYDPESFEDFCGNYGYDEDSRAAEKTYKAVVKEFRNLERLFSSDELESMQKIN